MDSTVELSSAQELAALIFTKNVNDKPIQLSIVTGCSNNQELFESCVEILTAGLQLLYGDASGHVDLANITPERIAYVQEKLRHAGICMQLQAVPKHAVPQEVVLGPPPPQTLPNNLPLGEYSFRIDNVDAYYNVSFSIAH